MVFGYAEVRILITGRIGFIGHNVVAQLEDLEHDVLIIDNMTDYGVISENEMDYLIDERSKKIFSVCHPYDIENRIPIDRTFDSFKPDIVIHLASFPRQKVVNSNPSFGARVMIEGLLNLCEAAKRNNVEKFVYVSSSMVYGNFTDGVTEDVECEPQGQYAIMKHAGELLVKDYHDRGAFDYTIIRPSAVYGPCDVEARVVSKFLLAALRDETINVNGPAEKLDFSYVDDVVDGIVTATLSDNTVNKCYNVTRGAARTLLEAAELAVKIAGKGKIQINKRDEMFPSRGTLNIDAARQDFGFDPKVDMEEGFQNYYEWLSNSSFWSKKTIL
jgi:nucleoside-diphosphate-sugar epimerase